MLKSLKSASFRMESDAVSFEPVTPQTDYTNFHGLFKEVKVNGNIYHCITSDIDLNQKMVAEEGKPLFTYNVTYFPMPKNVTQLDKDLKPISGKMENDEPIVFPLLVNINKPTWKHPCKGDPNENAGDYNCAKPLTGESVLFQTDIDISPLPAPFNSLVSFKGKFYIIPLLSSKLDVFYVATKDKKAVEKFQEDLLKMNKITGKQEFYIAIDSMPITIDDWSCAVSIFNLEEGELKGIRFVQY